MKTYTFKLPTPKGLESEKKLSDLKLKLAEYSDNIKYSESNMMINVDLKIPDDYNMDELAKLIIGFGYKGHS